MSAVEWLRSLDFGEWMIGLVALLVVYLVLRCLVVLLGVAVAEWETRKRDREDR